MTPKERIIPLFIPHEGCDHRCAFCNQHTIAGSERAPTEEEVIRTLEEGLPKAGEGAEAAFYGGSFTAIPREKMLSYLDATDRFLRTGRISGVRVSTRPDAIDRETVNLLKAHGVKLIELGAQSMKEDVLLAARRGHTAEDVRRAAGCIHEGGLALGLQMMTGLPEDTDQKAMETAREFIALSPAVVRIYPTLVLPGTALSALYRMGIYRPQTVPEAVGLAASLYELFTASGVRVIRMGVNESQRLSSDVEAGPYHPAFGELVFSELYKRRAEAALRGRDLAGKDLILRVPTGEESKMIGQKKSNIGYLMSLTGAKRIRVNPPGEYPDEVRLSL